MTTSVITALTDVWDAVSTWLVGAFKGIMPMFYDAESGLTFMGVLAAASLGVGLIFLLIRIVQNFIHFRS